MMATWTDSPETVRLLLGKGANAAVKDTKGWTALTHAVSAGSNEAVKLLLEEGGEVNSKDKEGQPLLVLAIINDHLETAKLLLEKGARADAAGSDHWPAIIWAVRLHGPEIVKLLLDKGASVEAKDEDDWTVLAHAASAGRPEMVKLLLENGADINARTSNGTSVLQLARSQGNADVLKLLRAERTKLEVLLREDQFEDETLTDELIDSKNKYLPGFIAASTDEQRVALLSEVEKRLIQAQRRIAELNSAAEDAVRQGQDAAAFRTRTGKVQAYMSVLKVIQKMLSQAPEAEPS
jgi:ankyrin repeat protein